MASGESSWLVIATVRAPLRRAHSWPATISSVRPDWLMLTTTVPVRSASVW